MRATMIPIIIGALGTVTKGLVERLKVLEIRGRVENIQTKALLRSARILRRLLKTWGDLLYLSDSFEKPSTNVGVKSSQNSFKNPLIQKALHKKKPSAATIYQ